LAYKSALRRTAYKRALSAGRLQAAYAAPEVVRIWCDLVAQELRLEDEDDVF
jgi:hypothetical protein